MKKKVLKKDKNFKKILYASLLILIIIFLVAVYSRYNWDSAGEKGLRSIWNFFGYRDSSDDTYYMYSSGGEGPEGDLESESESSVLDECKTDSDCGGGCTCEFFEGKGRRMCLGKGCESDGNCPIGQTCGEWIVESLNTCSCEKYCKDYELFCEYYGHPDTGGFPICCDKECTVCDSRYDGGCIPVCGETCTNGEIQPPKTCIFPNTLAVVCCENDQDCPVDEYHGCLDICKPDESTCNSGDGKWRICCPRGRCSYDEDRNPSCLECFFPESKLCKGKTDSDSSACCQLNDICNFDLNGDAVCDSNRYCYNSDGTKSDRYCPKGYQCCGYSDVKASCVPQGRDCCLDSNGGEAGNCPSGTKCCGDTKGKIKCIYDNQYCCRRGDFAWGCSPGFICGSTPYTCCSGGECLIASIEDPTSIG